MQWQLPRLSPVSPGSAEQAEWGEQHPSVLIILCQGDAGLLPSSPSKEDECIGLLHNLMEVLLTDLDLRASDKKMHYLPFRAVEKVIP